MAVERVKARLRKVTGALNDAGVRYAVIGGNAVAVWVSTADPGATRTTVDVDLLVRREDLPRISAVFSQLGFDRHDPRRLVLFVDPDEPSRRGGVHLVWANEKVRPSYAYPAPDVDESVLVEEDFRVLGLSALLRMKLITYRDLDRVHVKDMIRVGLVDTPIRATLPADLAERLDALQAELVEEDD